MKIIILNSSGKEREIEANAIKIVIGTGEYELWETIGGDLAVNTDEAETYNGNSYLKASQDVVDVRRKP